MARPGHKDKPDKKFVQLVAVEASLYALDSDGQVFKFNRERDAWFPMSIEVIIESPAPVVPDVPGPRAGE